MGTKSVPSRPGVKYLVVPTWVTDERTGERRHLKAHDLIRLYGLKPRTYRVVDDRPSVPDSIERARREGLIILYPDPSGKYTLPDIPSEEKPEDAPTALTDQVRRSNQEMQDRVQEEPLSDSPQEKTEGRGVKKGRGKK